MKWVAQTLCRNSDFSRFITAPIAYFCGVTPRVRQFCRAHLGKRSVYKASVKIRNVRIAFGSVLPGSDSECGHIMRWQLKHITNPGFGHNVARVRRIFLDFLAYLLYDYANKVGFFPIFGPPDYL
jgi:hypothetical protein